MEGILKADNLGDLYGIAHGFFTRAGGFSQGVYASLNCDVGSADSKESVIGNRRNVALRLDIPPENLLSCKQVHSAKVIVVKDHWDPLQNPEGDAMVTNAQGLALGILTADCAPVLFADVKAGVIGAAHAGWRSALSGVIENTVKAMEELGANRGNIQAAIGPCIGKTSYEVGTEFLAPFLTEKPEHQKFFLPSPRGAGKFLFDLAAYITEKLRALYVFDVAQPPSDTFADEARFFSHRRACARGEQATGRHISVIMRIPPKMEKPKDEPIEEEINPDAWSRMGTRFSDN